MLVGEQPGDKEDLAGHPFVGPAGKLLDEALTVAGINKSDVYITNAVKHFNWAPGQRGKGRIHKKPRYSEIQACRPWLEAEISATHPQIIICLGATAARALLGKDFSLMRQRGKFVPSPLAPRVIATVHPSSILRAQDDESRREQKAFIRDLAVAARELQALAKVAWVTIVISAPTASSARGIVCDFYEPFRQISQARSRRTAKAAAASRIQRT